MKEKPMVLLNVGEALGKEEQSSNASESVINYNP